MKSNLKPFQQALRRAGFVRTLNYRGLNGGQTYSRVLNDVKVDVQLWFSGSHRTSHWHAADEADRKRHAPILRSRGIQQPRHYGVMDTMPSYFETPDGMMQAIAFEATRGALGISKDVQRRFP